MSPQANAGLASGGGGIGIASDFSYNSNGSGTQRVGQDGTPNTGGGGAGSTQYSTGGTGGSGVVIIRYLSFYSAAISTTGSPITYTSGPYRVYVFNASGTITF
jgi:hypothetical protein